MTYQARKIRIQLVMTESGKRYALHFRQRYAQDFGSFPGIIIKQSVMITQTKYYQAFRMSLFYSLVFLENQ